jgi:hypothetical protein
MAFDFNTAALTDSLAFLDTSFPATSVLEIRTGAPPGVANAAAGTVLVSFTLAAGPWAAAAGAARALANLPLSANATAAGVAGHFRLRNAADTRRIEGSVTVTGGGGDLTLDNTNIANGQQVQVTGFTVNATDNQL